MLSLAPRQAKHCPQRYYNGRRHEQGQNGPQHIRKQGCDAIKDAFLYAQERHQH